MISGQNPQRILGCPICGYRVDPKDQTCPRCGSEFYEGTKFECPLCGGLVSSRDKSCPSCHVDYGDFRTKSMAKGSEDSIDALLTEIIGAESAQIKKEDKRYSCPNCSWMLDGSESVCPRCNHDLVTDLSFQCPVCGAIVGSNARVCPECNASFDEGLEEEESLSPSEPPKVSTKPTPAREVVKAPEAPPPPPPPPPPEPPREVKPVVVVKPAKVVARPEEPKAPEPARAQAELSFDMEMETADEKSAPARPEDSLERLEQQLELDAELDKATEQLAAMAVQPPKKGTKKRKLKAKSKK